MENQILELQYAIDTFYFLVMGALVMWMAAGFSMLEAGLVRSKNTAEILTKDGNVSHKFASGETFTIVICALDEDGGESCRTEELPVALLEQLEESGLPGFGLLGVITALGIIGILRRRTH